MILLTGDLHGTNGFERLRKLKQLPLEYDDFLIVLGDFGVIWHNITAEHYDKNQEGLKWLEQNVRCQILFVDGNHENFDRLEKYPVTEWNGGKVRHINEQVTHLTRGQVFTIEGKKFFTMGGAKSVDKHKRKEFVSWWKQETPSFLEYQEGLCNLEKVNFEVNYVLTHDCPTHIANLFGYEGKELINRYFSTLVLNYKLYFKRWYFGHYHEDKRMGSFSCLYEDIEILESGTLV